MDEALAALEITPKIKQTIEHHAEEELVYETMESLKKIKINRPLLKEMRQTEKYAKYIKDLVANKPRTEEYEEIRMNPRCSALLQNQPTPKEQDPGSFILPCSIGRLDFNNALVDLGVSVNVMPLSMYKHLGIGKLKPINMVIEMADNTKCTPKGIVENILIKFDKFIFLVDFVILEMVEDFRMPIILGIPLLATANAKVDIFRKSISLEVGNEKVIFKMRSSFTTTIFEYVPSIRSKTCSKDDDFKKLIIIYSYTILNPVLESMQDDQGENWRERFEDEEDDIDENSEDPEECGEDKENIIMGVIHDKLNDDWLNSTSKDKDNLEGILNYLEPRSDDGFIDLDNKAYNKRKYRLLRLTYKKPPPILKILRDNVAAIRPRLIAMDRSVQAKTFSQQENGIRGQFNSFSCGKKDTV
ncbi:zinc knuckle CX2CX4HX4C containing protein [Tanacetum coccineum]